MILRQHNFNISHFISLSINYFEIVRPVVIIILLDNIWKAPMHNHCACKWDSLHKVISKYWDWFDMLHFMNFILLVLFHCFSFHYYCQILSHWLLCCMGQSLSFVYSFSRNGFSFPSVSVYSAVQKLSKMVVLCHYLVVTNSKPQPSQFQNETFLTTLDFYFCFYYKFNANLS